MFRFGLVEVERKGFSDFSFLFFLSFPLPPSPPVPPRNAIRKNTARSLFARLWGREGNWWGNRVAGVGRGSASAAERRFSRALSTHRERCVRDVHPRARAHACAEKEREFVAE